MAGGKRSALKGKRIYHYQFRLNEVENQKFLELLERSGARTRTDFIISRIFGWEFRVVTTNAEEAEYFKKLSTFHRQFAAVGNNYNQTTKAIRTNFGEKRATQMLESLRKDTAQLAYIGMKIVYLPEEYKEKWLSQ